MPSPIRGILKPTISVVMPSFNCLQYLPRALSSIYIQQCDDLEILVADDASTDGSWDWLQEQAARQPQLRPIRTEGVGPAVARNRCIAEARGEYVAFLDADDSWHPHKLATQLAFHREHPEVVFSFTDYRCISPQGEDLGGSFDYWQKFGRIAGKHSGYRLLDAAPAVLFAENPVGTSSVMARRDALQDAKGFDSALPSAEDWDLWLRLAGKGRVGFTEQVTMHYLVRPDSETAKSEARLEALEIIYRRYVEQAARIDPAAPRTARARMAVARAEHLRMRNQHSRAFGQHLRAFFTVPGSRTLRAAAVDAKRLLMS